MKTFKLVFGYVGKGGKLTSQSECMISATDNDSAIDIQEEKFIDWMLRNPSKAKRRYCTMYLIEYGILMDTVKTKYFDNL